MGPVDFVSLALLGGSNHQDERRKNVLLNKIIALTAAVLTAGCVPPPTDESPVPEVAPEMVTVGVLSDSYEPQNPIDSDTSRVELGLKFSPTESGTLEGVQFYQNTTTSGVTSVSVWSSTGARLARVTPTASPALGWRTVPVDVALTAGQTYTVSVYDSNARYPSTSNYFTAAQTVNGIDVPANAGVYRYGSTSGFPTSSWSGSNYLVDVVYTYAAPEPEPDPEPDPEPVPDPADTRFQYLNRSWPDETTTGVPAGTVLTPYTGPCTITVANTVIDSKDVTCDLNVRAAGVVIKNSRLTSVYGWDAPASFTISDSTVQIGNRPGTGIGDANFTAERVHVTGGNRSIACYLNCTVRDSYVHGQFTDYTGVYHESGIRVNTNSHLIHNTIACDAPDIPPDAGCSAAITGYPDFDAVTGNVVENNLILGDSGGYCTYGGSTNGKPYSGQTRDIVFRDNVWQRGTSGKCGFWGPVTDFDLNAPGNVWSNNLWTDGAVVTP